MMARKILSLKVSEEEMDMIQDNYRDFLMTERKPWSRHKWMKSLILDRPPIALEAVTMENS